MGGYSLGELESFGFGVAGIESRGFFDAATECPFDCWPRPASSYAIKGVDESVGDPATAVACHNTDRVGWQWVAGGEPVDPRNRIRTGAYVPATALDVLEVVSSGRPDGCVQLTGGAANGPDDAF